MLMITLLVTQLGMAVINDLHNYKVRNEITFTFAMIGIIYNAWTFDLQFITSSLVGMLLPFILLLPLYALKMLGAGDIKLFCSMGALVGATNIMLTMAYSFLAGGVIAIIVMLYRKNLIMSIKYFLHYIRGCAMTVRFLEYDDLQSISNRKIHFTLCIALGTVVFFLM